MVCILRLAYMTLRHLTIAYAFRNPALSVTKCRYLQSLLRCVKSNALRLNEIFTQHFLYITALTYTWFGINRSCITSPNLKATTPLLSSQNKYRHAVQYILHLYWYSHMFIPYFFCIICNRSLHYMQKVMKNFVQVHQNKHIHTQNAMPQASIRP